MRLRMRHCLLAMTPLTAAGALLLGTQGLGVAPKASARNQPAAGFVLLPAAPPKPPPSVGSLPTAAAPEATAAPPALVSPNTEPAADPYAG